MKTKDLYRLDKIVTEILEKDYRAREDDAYLIFLVVQKTRPELKDTQIANARFEEQNEYERYALN